MAVTEAGARPRSVSLALVLLAAALVLSVVATVIFLATFFRDPYPAPLILEATLSTRP